MKVQKPGRAEGGCMTPLKMRDIPNPRMASMPPRAGSGRAEMTSCAKLEAKM